ncbi:hypothetical protein [Natranaeroarchaeum aerophilus]|uniref:Uncharacterized protein n=1 Tax=Natranaeroarchaeum aerophilus TaxID=2917711 RepID=A0AAE3FQE5_9EURY|nr:hypothetical protein [Natranaeroarchaeum aerophilus]MCL9813727.1 hypothetical protein [Natranaeroarchaeum aerophilus]
MAKITLFEFNPRGRIQIGPSGPDDEGLFSADIDRTDEDGGEEAETAEEDDSGLGIAAVLIPLVILAVIGVAVKTLLGGDDEEEELELDEEEEGPVSRFTSTTE